jgi:sterol desaturase/sphingolipid hydroxylase (fatty acid hydroxylase superfamily)
MAINLAHLFCGEGIYSFPFLTLCLFVVILVRYLVVAGLTWWLVCSRFNLLDQDIFQDIRSSVVSAAIFAMAMAAAIELHILGYTRIYNQLGDHGWWYIGGSYCLVLIMQDSYFYITHRLFHCRSFYSWAHQGHHRSRRPSPWTSFAFEPMESLSHAMFLLGVICLIPLHLGTIFAVLTTMTIWAVVNHLDLEQLPVRFPHHWLGRWIIGPAHHSVHHNSQNKHFGLYFTFWDRLLGTEDHAYIYRIKDETCLPNLQECLNDEK